VSKFKTSLTSLNSNYQVRTHFARPNWKKVFSKMCSKHCNGRIGQLVSIKHIAQFYLYVSLFFVFFYSRISKIFFHSSFSDIMVVMIRIRGILLWCTSFGQRTKQALLRVQWKGSNKIWVPQGALLRNLDGALPTVLKVNRVTSQLKPIILVT